MIVQSFTISDISKAQRFVLFSSISYSEKSGNLSCSMDLKGTESAHKGGGCADLSIFEVAIFSIEFVFSVILLGGFISLSFILWIHFCSFEGAAED
ncbi:unnamed protein product, partial [Linum tenue]